jgi:LacI family transcriptional regulator
VADRAEVSISTVSHVVNETRHVEEDTRAKILSAISDLDYRPNQFARGLRGAKTATIGLIISDIREDFFSFLTKTIESAANEHGYTVILCDSEEDVAKERLYLEILAGKGVDGIIIAPVDSDSPPRLPAGHKPPIVQVDRRCPDSGLDFAGIDNRKYAAEAVRYLHSAGYGEIGFVGHEPGIWTMGERAEGFRSAMKELGHPAGGRVLIISSRGANPKAVVKRWMTANPGLEALICGNANICFAALAAAEERAGADARKLGLVAFDDLECFHFLRDPVTTICQPTERMGLAALELLISRIKTGGQQQPREVLLPAKLIIREASPRAAKRPGAAAPGNPAKKPRNLEKLPVQTMHVQTRAATRRIPERSVENSGAAAGRRKG